MPNVKKPRQEDPQAETRVDLPTVAAAPAVAAPTVTSPAGGAPKVTGEPQMDIFIEKAPTLEPIRRDLPTWDDVKAEADRRAVTPTWRPLQNPALAYRSERANTRLGQLYEQRLDPTKMEEAPKPPWTVAQVKEAEPEFVAATRDALWEMYTNASEEEKQSMFMQGIKQNPEYAAATLVRRMLDNAIRRDQFVTGEVAPTLGEAAQTSLELNNTWRWLNYALGVGGKPATAPPVPPPQAARAGLTRGRR